MNQKDKLDKLKNYADFSMCGNGSYKAKRHGITITIHTNGNIQYQGNDDNKNKVEQEINMILNNPTSTINNKQLFIVYGHDSVAKEQLEHILDKLDIQTNQITNNTGMTIIEALESEMSNIHVGIILLTPDDIAISKRDYEKHKDDLDNFVHIRARQNVILEMGMIMAKLGRENTIILAKGNVEIPSDIDGIFRLPFKDHPKEVLVKLVERLEKCGFKIDKENVFEAMK